MIKYKYGMRYEILCTQLSLFCILLIEREVVLQMFVNKSIELHK